MNEGTCSAAAKNGRLPTLVYLHENGCTWDKQTYMCAEIGEHKECLQYLEEQGCDSYNTIATAIIEPILTIIGQYCSQ